jgi:uncharacterized membrane protein (DUF106 family)
LYNTPIFYAFVVFIVTFVSSLASFLIRLRFANPQDTAKWQEEMKRYNSDKEAAKKTGDKKLIAQLRKQEKRISQIQSKMMKGQLISLVVIMVMFFALWQVLGSYILGKKVAFSPFFIPFLMDANSTLPYEMPFVAWYFICSFFSSTLLQRFLGTGFGTGSQLGTTK